MDYVFFGAAVKEPAETRYPSPRNNPLTPNRILQCDLRYRPGPDDLPPVLDTTIS